MALIAGGFEVAHLLLHAGDLFQGLLGGWGVGGVHWGGVGVLLSLSAAAVLRGLFDLAHRGAHVLADLVGLFVGLTGLAGLADLLGEFPGLLRREALFFEVLLKFLLGGLVLGLLDLPWVEAGVGECFLDLLIGLLAVLLLLLGGLFELLGEVLQLLLEGLTLIGGEVLDGVGELADGFLGGLEVALADGLDKTVGGAGDLRVEPAHDVLDQVQFPLFLPGFFGEGLLDLGDFGGGLASGLGRGQVGQRELGQFIKRWVFEGIFPGGGVGCVGGEG